MVNIRVVEAFKHIGAELLQFFHRKVECLHEFVELNFVDIFANDGMVASVTHDVHAAEEGNG